MRYFYTDPLAAAWMAKHFGMKFKDEHIEVFPVRSWISLQDLKGIDVELKEFAKFYLHPDSVKLLEPQHSDVVLCAICGTDGKHLYDDAGFASDDGRVVTDLFYNDDKGIKTDDCKIIQRNGIAFHWPEVEA